jgi:methionyl-tRNA formyltransferase
MIFNRRAKSNYRFYVHWSKIIPERTWKKYNCIGFHAGDLPKDKGGTPIQNLIMRGKKKTKITAFRINGTIDGGDILLKRPLDLSGSAEQIYQRMYRIIDEMCEYIEKHNPKPKPQKGKGTYYPRRKPEQSNLKYAKYKNLYDFIRMLDAKGYPRAYIDINDFRLEFCDADKKGAWVFWKKR